MTNITRKQRIRALLLEKEYLEREISFLKHENENIRTLTLNDFMKNSGMLERVIAGNSLELTRKLSDHLATHLIDGFQGISSYQAQKLHHQISNFLSREEVNQFMRHISKRKSPAMEMQFSMRKDHTHNNYNRIRIDLPSLHIETIMMQGIN
jgi:hypothetical protein